jgi:hypothetical protein
MSLVKYILSSCGNDLRYRVNFTGATSLNIGEIWYVECGGIESGCYEVLENTDELLDEYNSDECTFIEFDDCDGCITTFGEELAAPEIYTWYHYRGCSNDQRTFPTGAVYLPINVPYAGQNVVYMFSETTGELRCFECMGDCTPTTSTVIPYTPDVVAITGFTDCQECLSGCGA